MTRTVRPELFSERRRGDAWEPNAPQKAEWLEERSNVDPPPRIVEGSDILNAKYPEMKWAVEGVIPEGACLLAGRPKTGKSWLAMNIALAIAHGGVALGKIKVRQGSVLYLALEDNEHRIQKRLRQLLEAQQMAVPKGCQFATAWPKPGRGGLDYLAAWLDKHTDGRLVIVDTMQRFRDAGSLQGNVYEEDYRAMSAIQQLAIGRSTAFVIITHTRKPIGRGTTDPLDEVQNSTGLTAAADAVLVIKRARLSREAKLFVTGRDVEERELPLTVDAAHYLWSIVEIDSNDPDAGCTAEQRRIREVLRNAPEAIAPTEVARILGRDANATAQLMQRMFKEGLIQRPCYGKYTLCHSPSLCHNDRMTENDIECT